MPRSTCRLGVGDRSSVHGLRRRGGRERTEILVTTASCYPGDSQQPQFWQHGRRQESLSDSLSSKHGKDLRQHQPGKSIQQPIFSFRSRHAFFPTRRAIQQLSSLVRRHLCRERDGYLDGPDGHRSFFTTSCTRWGRGDGAGAN